MVSTIDTAFVEQYNTDVLHVLQRMEPKFPGMARPGRVNGDTAYWQRYGTLGTQTKVRGARLTATDIAHTRKSVTIADSYVYSEIDDLDLLKINVDERQAYARAHVAALNREKDDVALTAWIAGVGADLGPGNGVALALSHALDLMEWFSDNHVPDDGRRFVAVSPKTWSKLLQIDQFANADYLTSAEAGRPFEGATAKRWLTFNWFMHATAKDPATEASKGGLPIVAATEVVSNLAWHTDMVGFADQGYVPATWDWENDLQGWSCGSRMAIGACVLEPDGVQLWSVDEADTPV